MFWRTDPAQDAPRIQRRLPVYIVADCSGGMRRYMPAVHSVINTIVNILTVDDRGLPTADISLIAFNDEATVRPLTPLESFRDPELEPLGKTELGRALKALNAAIDTDMLPNRTLPSGATLGFFRPLVYLITDGDPSLPEKEPMQPHVSQLRERAQHRPKYIVAVAVGANPRLDVLGTIADKVFIATEGESLTTELREYIDWEPE